jgi:hypothetical protein
VFLFYVIPKCTVFVPLSNVSKFAHFYLHINYIKSIRGGKDKGKVVPVLFLNEDYAIKAYWEWRYSSTHSLTKVLDGGEWSISRPVRFTPRERALCTHWIGG